ncbi:MAG: protein-disulfide reductase DsbD family protein [Bacteroidota bacterium]
MKRIFGVLMGTVLLGLSPFLVFGQGMVDPVTYEVTQAPQTIKKGERADVTIRASIEGDWHLYSINVAPDAGPVPTTFSLANDQVVLAGEVTETEPKVEYDPNFDTELGWHSGGAEFTLPIAVKTNVSDGSVPLEIDVRYMVCNDRACLPPKTKSIQYVLEVSGTAESPIPAATASAETSMNGGDEEAGAGAGTDQSISQTYAKEGVLSFLWIALTAGFAALLTPCVFPMIPLTVSFFSKQSGGSSQKAFSQAMLFGLAIVGTFTVLGALLSLIIGASGANQFAANPWVNLFIGIVLVVFAVSLLGMFELRLPYQLTNYLNRKSNESGGLTGILFMGLTISAVSFSCTAPFVGGVLAATTGGEWFYPILGMIGFSAAFSTPFILFAMFPNWLESLPKSGSWMNVVKILLGFIELAAAFKFISNADLVWEWGIVTRPFAIAAWIGIFLIAGLYTLGVIGIGHDEKPERVTTGRMLLAIPLLTFSFYLMPGLFGASLGIWDAWLPPKQATDVSLVSSMRAYGGSASTAEASGEEQWSEDYASSQQVAQEANMPIFIDFTGYTCTNCRAMEANVFPLEPVQEKFAQMEKVRLYTDDGADGPENQKFQFELTGTVALPTYVIVDPHSGQIINQLVGYANKDQFTQFLETGLKRFNERKSG